MLRWSNGIARHEIKWCTSSNAASASRFGLLRDEMVFSRALVEQTCLGAPEQHEREPRRPKPVPYTKIRRLRRPGNFWRFFGVFSGQIRFRTRMARTPVGGPDRNAQKADFQYPASVCIVRGPITMGLCWPAGDGDQKYARQRDRCRWDRLSELGFRIAQVLLD